MRRRSKRVGVAVRVPRTRRGIGVRPDTPRPNTDRELPSSECVRYFTCRSVDMACAAALNYIAPQPCRDRKLDGVAWDWLVLSKHSFLAMLKAAHTCSVLCVIWTDWLLNARHKVVGPVRQASCCLPQPCGPMSPRSCLVVAVMVHATRIGRKLRAVEVARRLGHASLPAPSTQVT